MKIPPDKNHLKIGELPDLKIIAAERLRFHEQPNRERSRRLVHRFRQEGILKNPPIVARSAQCDDLVILDGANRITALGQLGLPHLLIQMVDIDDALLELDCWYHAVEGYDRDFVLDKIRRIPKIEVFEDHSPGLGHNGTSDFAGDRTYLCSFTFRDGRTWSIRDPGRLDEQVHRLNAVTDFYIHRACSDRVSYTRLDHLRKHYPDFGVLVSFRRFKKDDFFQIVETGLRLPSGVTRVFLPKRALGMNAPLDLLKSPLSLEEKNRWLTEQIRKKVREKSIRFYREPTFVFDE